MTKQPASHRPIRHFTPRRLVLALAGCAWLGMGQASPPTLPTGLQVVQGQATAVTNGSKLTITNSNGAILNWQSFSIGAGNSVRFDQPSATSQVLNRVTGNDPSSILGSLSSNGRVWLLNPNGVLFGQGARVDVAGLVTSTLNLNDSDWTAGRYLFTTPAGSAQGSIVNQGEIRSAAGGQVLLLAGAGGVSNEGLIDTQGGQIVLAAGASIELLDTATPRFTVKVTAPAGEVLNLGSLNAGRIDVQAATVNQQGVVRADSLGVGPGGEIVLQASERVTLADGSITSATAANGQGGSIDVLGNEAVLLGSALVDASGASGGGAIRIGGDFHGAGTLPTAARTYVGSGVQLHADATGRGDGGSVVVWSDDNTRFLGSLSARGGADGGNGGFAEVSGKQFLDFRGFADLGSVAGARGTLLLDPLNLTIQATGADVNGDGSNADLTFGTVAWDYAPGANSVITSGAVQSMLSTGDVVLEATNNITVNSAINAGGAAHALTMHAGNDIDVNASIGGMLALSLTANYTFTSGTNPPAPSGVGALHFGTGVQLGAGNITLNAAGSIILPTVNASGTNGNINVTSTAGGISQTGAITTTQIGSSFTASGIGSSIDLGSQANSIAGLSSGFLTFSAPQDVIIRDQGSISIPTSISNLGGKLVLISDTGSITQTAPFSVGADGSSFTTSATGQTIALTQANVLSGHTVSLNTTGTAADASLTGDTINFAASTIGGKLTAAASTGGISQSGALVLGADGSSFTTAAAGQSINLTDTGNKFGNFKVGFTTAAGGDVSVTAEALSFAGSSIGGNLTATAIDGLSAQAGTITINNASVVFTGSGALSANLLADNNVLLSSALLGNNGIPLNVTLSAGSGVVSLNSSSISSGGGAIVLGGGGSVTLPNGGSLSGAAPGGVSIANSSVVEAGSGSVSLYGASASSQSGVGVSASSQVTGRQITVHGSSSFGPGVEVDTGTLTAGSGPMTITGVGGTGIELSGATLGAGGDISMSVGGSSATMSLSSSTITTTGGVINLSGASAMTLSGSQITADGLLTIQADSLTLSGGSALISNRPSGDAILIEGNNGTGIGHFVNMAGSQGLQVNGGRWIVWSADINDENNFDSQISDYDFTRYGATGPASWANDVGNGFVSSTQPNANLNGFTPDKTYDGTRAVTSTGTSFNVSTSVGTATVASGATLLFDSKDAGYGSVNLNDDSLVTYLDGNNKPIYGLTLQSHIQATINPADLTITLAALDKVYDRTTTANVTASTTGLVAGEQLTITTSGTFSDKNVGTDKGVEANVSVNDGTGANAGLTSNYNWNVVNASGLKASITPATLYIGGLTAQNRIYNGGTGATLTGTAQVTPISGDDVSLQGTASGSFADKNVANGKTVSVTGLSLGGDDGGNYVLAFANPLTANITPLNLTVSGLTAVGKTYDATTVATLGGTASVFALPGDSVSVQAGYVGNFSDKNVGTGKTVTVSGLVLTGADAGNYTVSGPSGSSGGLTADITPASLLVSGLVAQNKVYDATLGATLGGTASLGSFAGDLVSVSGTGSAQFTDKNVGTGKTVTVSGLSLTGADAGNYTLVQPTGLKANITPATLQIGGLTAGSKVYDATTAATLGGTASVSAFAGDTVGLAGTASGAFADKNVGAGKQVTVSGLSLTGADAGNYTLVSQPNLAADITPAMLSYVADPVTKALNAALPALSGSVSGFLGDDTQANSTSGSLSFTTSATATSPQGSYAINGQGLEAQNYQFVQAPGNASALTVSAPTTASPPQVVIQSTAVAIQSVAPVGLTMPTAPTSMNTSSGMVDLTSPPASSGSTASPVAASFAPVRLSALSMDALASLLAERDAYKQALLAEAAAKLEKNPGLADVHACQSLSEAAAGTCAVTDELKRKAQAEGTAQALASAPVAAPAAAPVPAPVAAAPAAPVVAAAPVAPPPAPVQALPTRRHVKLAALPQIERKVAVVIGVDAYEDRTIPSLGNAINDAEAMGSMFEGKLGYETVVIPNATKASVIGTLNRLALAMGPKDSVSIYYAGHGELVQQTGQGYWLLSDADAKKPETWLSNADIGRLINQIGASQVALISDSCYSGSLVSDERIRPSGTPPDPAQVLQQKSVVVMSSGGNEPVSDAGKQGHSPFTFNLLNQLGQLKQWQAGGNVFERVRFAVARELPQRPQYGASAAAGHQRGGDYLFEQRQLDVGPQ
ncbi:YDG domain-containing protein [Paucibacter sp. R3-3]|uniref:YDG domain-containing protein n=1 Tax=Roseateles agri TaxID=3098619 RepID=A0ABU5DI37_9BURK|nr:YDG domain-containing protein [Paucibacter sp. R3-3]MDY0745958.1 YDG domain-containing protein [Paucibacter sp. R3-3]